MLTIGKPTVFNSEDGLAIPGQYALDTGGWVLRWFSRGEEAVLYTGPLAVCRRFQAACRGLDDPEAIRRTIDNRQLGETVEVIPLSPMPTEVYPPVDDEHGGHDEDGPEIPPPSSPPRPSPSAPPPAGRRRGNGGGRGGRKRR